MSPGAVGGPIYTPMDAATGWAAARMLLDGIADAGSAPRRKVLGALVIRASTAPAGTIGIRRLEVMAHA